jgi:predicted aldo/keto reductase-like oxidoreductase
MKTDHIDIYQFHNPAKMPRPSDGTGLYEAALEAREQGKILFIGLTNHRLPVAREAAESGLYALLQFPFSYLSDEKDEALVKTCAEKGVAFVAMKALSGGLLTDIGAAHGWMAGFPVVPIWGIQRWTELEALLEVVNEPSTLGLTPARLSRIERDRAELSGDFCRGCGYCLPCPAKIEINMCARMSLFMKRAPSAPLLGEHWQKEMAKIADCRHCNHCKEHCPYGLDTPALLARNYEEYKRTVSAPAP